MRERMSVRCPQKITYETWSEAEDAALRLAEDLRDDKLPIRKSPRVFAYRCLVCQKWHVGHQPKPAVRVRAR